jgi:hypothetical protein
MRGHFFHNQILVEPLALKLEKLGAKVFREYPIRRGRHPRYVDLYVELGHHRIVCEGERTIHRLAGDVVKALSLRADLLLVVVATGRMAGAARRYLNPFLKDGTISNTQVLILPLGAALQLLNHRSQLMSLLKVTPILAPKTPVARSDLPAGAHTKNGLNRENS